MIVNPSRFLAVTLSTFVGAATAIACPAGQKEECKFGICICIPDFIPVPPAPPLPPVPPIPLPDTIFVDGVPIKVNVDRLSQSVGQIILGTDPIFVAFGNKIINAKDRNFIASVVGRGFILYTAGVDPRLIVIDTANQVAGYISLREQQNPFAPPAAQLPPGVQPTVYHATTAKCMFRHDDKTVFAGWVTPFSVTNTATGVVTTYPSTGLRKNDIVNLTSPICPEYEQPNQHPITQARVTFDYATSADSPGNNIHFILVGKETP